MTRRELCFRIGELLRLLIVRLCRVNEYDSELIYSGKKDSMCGLDLRIGTELCHNGSPVNISFIRPTKHHTTF